MKPSCLRIVNESGTQYAQRLSDDWNSRDEAEEVANAHDVWPKKFSCKFIEHGLVNYQDIGTVLVRKEALDKMAQSFVGKPVVNEVHRDVSPSDFQEGDADGIVTKVWFNDDGWYWAEFLVWDAATQRNCLSNAYSVSCAYVPSQVSESGGVHNNIPYEAEVLDGSYTHLAVVANPRYEDARIIYNSRGGEMKFLKFWKSKKEKEARNSATEIATDKAVVMVDGKRVPVSDLLALHNAQQVQNAEPLSEETVMEVDGVEMPLKNLINAYREKEARNAEDEDKKAKEEEERKNAEAEEDKKKKEDEERKNAEEKEADEKKKKEMENASGKEGDLHFSEVQKAALRRGEVQQPQIVSRREQAEQGAKRYGSKA